MAFNHKTQTQAFFAAEAGIDDALNVASTPSVALAVAKRKGITSAWDKAWANKKLYLSKANIVVSKKDKNVNTKASFKIKPFIGKKVYWYPNNKVFKIISKGKFTVGNNKLSERKLVAQISPATLYSPFLAGIVSKNKVTIGGTPMIDSYNSNYGKYGKQLSSTPSTYNTSKGNSQINNLVLVTCSSNGKVLFNGKPPNIYGNVSSSAKICTNQKCKSSSSSKTLSNYIHGISKTSTYSSTACQPYKSNKLLSQLFNNAKKSPNVHKLNIKGRDLTLGHAQNKIIYKTGGLSTVNNLNIKGNVTIIVNGNVQFNGNINILSSKGSLKLLVTGKTTLKAKTNINGSFVRKNAKGQSIPAISLYSTYAKNRGVTIHGNSKTNIAVYAPRSGVKLTGNSGLYGSVIGRSLSQHGTSSIHYNVALSKISVCNRCKSSNANVQSWHQVQG